MTEKKPGYIRRVLSFTGRFITAVRHTVLNLVFLLILAVIFAALLSQEATQVPEGSVLVIAPTGEVVDQRSFVDPVTRILDPESIKAETRLQDMIDALEHAAADDRIVAVHLDLAELGYISMGSTLELGEALTAFREAGKKVVATGDSYGQQHYLLASYADDIYLHNMGAVMIQGMGAYPTFFKDALDKLNIDVHVFRVGEYKSAVEPFLRNNMSQQAKQNTLQWLSSLWSSYMAILGDNRDLDAESITEYVNNFDLVLQDVQGNSAHAALNRGLVDHVVSREDMRAALMDLSPLKTSDEALLSFDDYLDASEPDPLMQPEDVIAVVVAQGVIVDGEQPPGVTGGDTVARLLKELRGDDAVKAVVLRVDSEGGSAFASEVMREQLGLLQAEGKPVVVSMGGIAASGGYWIAAGADEIWAQPTTITGSIGIFGVFPTINRTLAKWGVYSDGVGTTRMADAFRIDRPMNDISANALQAMINDGYQRFIQLVSDSRGLSVDAVHDIAQGRVWSGEDALAIGLVDGLGGLKEAARSAASLAGVSDYRLSWKADESWYEESVLDRIMASMSRVLTRQMLQSVQAYLPLASVEMPQMPVLNDPKGIYLHCMVCTPQR